VVSYRLAFLLAILIIGIVFSFTFLQLPGNTLFWNSLQNSGHAIVFAGLCVVAMYLLHHLHRKHTLLHIICVGLGLSALGILIEFTQQITGRGASPSDLLMNTAGIVC
ncbi:unnamed protein product, partial [Hapterophycus canaliculatus]